ncbi:MAG: sensor histidine kinase [Acidobacteriia bacterium]|nr:sensor histidine kinase [Terriglobia bacterium]
MPLLPRFGWPRWVSAIRPVLAAAALVLLPDAPWYLKVFLGLYALGALAWAVRGATPSGMGGLLILFVDAVVFLVLANYGNGGALWLVSAFFLYLLTEALAFHGPLEVAVVALVGAVFCGLVERGDLPLERTVLVSGALACGFAVSRRRQKAEADALRQQLDEAQKRAEKAREAERQRIASDFHDGPLQSFISLQMRLEILRKLLDRDFNAGMEDLKQLQGLALAQVRDLRAFLHSMRPVDVDGANLVATARRTAESFQKESGIPVTFLGANTPVGLPPEMTLEVLQMLREALHNVQKHAAATRVAVAMEKTERGLEISVDDNGHGFSFAGAYTLEELELLRLGPASLKRRARSLNADLLLESRPGRGVGLKFRIPLP